jgi:acetylglutamate/LysW-gamma-L-alpha-aminoadipate kinase
MIVVKAGGSKGVAIEAVCNDVAELVQHGEQVVLVHGGSHETNILAEKLGHPPRFVTSPSGHSSRYTDREALEIFTMVAGGRINKSLVVRLQQLGVNAVGLCGLDGRLLEGKRKSSLRIVENGKCKILRGEYSGTIEQVNTGLLVTLLAAGYVPVVAPLAISYESEAMNVDILSNGPGVLRDVSDESTVIPRIPLLQAQSYLERYAKGRMKRKVLGAVEALNDGVQQVIISDGRIPSPVQQALAGAGTVIQRQTEGQEWTHSPW